MVGAFWICVFMIVVDTVLYIGELRWRRRHGSDANAGQRRSDVGAAAQAADGADMAEGSHDADGADVADGQTGECCGMHLVCEKDTLSPISDEIIYYDDEELDRFIGRDPHSYTPEETEEFRDVLMTLRPEDVPGWARSVTQRHLELPPDVRDELLMLVNDLRSHRPRP